MTDNSSPGDDANPIQADPTKRSARLGTFSTPLSSVDEHTDNRKPWDWESKYPRDARTAINTEACYLVALLAFFLLFASVFLGLMGESLQIPLHFLDWPASDPAGAPSVASEVPILTIEFRLLAIFAVGGVGGTTFSIKWLVHSTAKGRWHLDRRYWRVLVPLVGGVYACVVLTLFNAGLFAGQAAEKAASAGATAALAFLIGYFSDGVSGLLSNVANAVFGTLEKK